MAEMKRESRNRVQRYFCSMCVFVCVALKPCTKGRFTGAIKSFVLLSRPTKTHATPQSRILTRSESKSQAANF